MRITIIGSGCVGLGTAIVSHFLDYQPIQQASFTDLAIGR